MKRLAILTIIPLMASVSVSAQDFEMDINASGSDMQQEEISAPDHRSDDAYLRRYSRQDEVSRIVMNASSRIKRKLVFYADMFGNAGSGDYAPFWFTSNRQGLSPIKNSGMLLDLGVDGGMSLPSHFKFNYGMEVAAGINSQEDFYLHQFYIEAGYKWFDLSVGSKERWDELVNHNLSTGGLTWSGNSRPIPQLRLEVPEFVRLNILGRLVSLKGHIAYGWYQDDEWRRERALIRNNPPQYTDKILHHSKSIFARIGDSDRFPLELTLGLEMYGQFGGTRHNMRTWASDPVIEEYEFPHDLKAYLQAFLPINKPGEQAKDNGNTLGSWDLAIDLTTDNWKYKLYYEHFYEDHSSMLGIENKADMNGDKGLVYYGFRRNWLDGLFGFEVDAPEGLPFNSIVLEVLNTRGQCGPIYRYQNSVIKEGVDGRDEMYNHEFYKSYTHFGYSNGSPVLASPLYNSNGDLEFKSNRVLMFHLGIDGNILPRLSYRLLATNTSHWGTYNHPLPEKENVTSLLAECFYKFKGKDGWKTGLSVGGDFGSEEIIGNNFGIMITFSKKWNLL